MKKVLFSVIMFAALLFVLPTSAQGVKFGVKGGINNTDMSFDEKVFNSSNRYGWFIGPTVKVTLPVLGVDFSLLYDQKATEMNGETLEQKSVVVPVNLRTQFGLGSLVGLYLAAGPQFEFNVGQRNFSWTDRDQVRNTFQLKESNFSFNLGAGVYLLKNIEVGCTYNIAIGRTGDTTFENAMRSTYDKSKAKTWTIMGAIYF